MSTRPIDPGAIAAEVVDCSHGAVVTFVGTVRDHHAGMQVTALRYECYGPMAEAECVKIVQEAELTLTLEDGRLIDNQPHVLPSPPQAQTVAARAIA